MVGMLLGLGQTIANAIGSVFSAVFQALVSPLLKLAFDIILRPLIQLLLEIIGYTVGYIGYVIGTFILKLIDFVEILFRALAGLNSESPTGMKLELSIEGDKGDILLQVIRNDGVQQAFLAMCIVGLFLLVVTTVFQIIKVEYTTEGAKNAKGPIFQKAFRGIANLMLLPLLVVFGIVFANQLLGLLDKATTVNSDGGNPTISGLIFVASASDAHYYKGEDHINITERNVIAGSFEAIEHAITHALEVMFNNKTESTQTYTEYENDIADVESGFISQIAGHHYYDIVNVTNFYNYASINYVLLLFGGVFVLKSLFFACFGMIIRLYKCAVLFIISPAVIGMTPINEGGLGKWRTSFIGQVLSAYGTILSINLFFVIVRVLLAIEVKFTYPGGAQVVPDGFFTSSFMTSLLKAIFVLAGCLLIEKFSKELGGYFGAEDAMGAGKDMANQVGDLAMKGVGAAAMVASGGASLAMKAGKAAGGIAHKIGGTGIGQAVKKGAGLVGGGIADGARWVGKNTGIGRGAVKVGKGAVKFGKGVANVAGKVTGGVKTGMAWMAHGQAGVDALNTGKLDDQRSDLGSAISEEKKKISAASNAQKELIKKHNWSESDIENIHKKWKTPGSHMTNDEIAFLTEGDNMTKAQIAIDSNKAKIKDLDKRKSAASGLLQEQATKRASRGNKLLNFVSGVEGMAESGRKNLPGSKYFKQFKDAAGTGAKLLGDPFDAAVKDVDYQKGKEKQDNAHAIMGGTINKVNLAGATLVAMQSSKELGATMKQMSKDIVKELQALKSYGDVVGKDSQEYKMQEAAAFQNLQTKGSTLNVGEFQGLVNAVAKGKTELDLKTDVKINLDPKLIEKAVTEALSKGAVKPEDITNALVKELEKVGLAGNKNLLKMISDIIEKKISEIK